MNTDDRLQHAGLLCERAVFNGDEAGLAVADRELDGVEADLALARGRLIHARHAADSTEDTQELALFRRAAELYRSLGDGRGEGEARLWIGIYHQVVRHDDTAAVPALDRACALAGAAGDRMTLSCALRHLGIAAHSAGRSDEARHRLEESTRLREELGFLPGVAANLVGLAYVAAAQGRTEDAVALAARAAETAGASGADAIVRQAEAARRSLVPMTDPGD